MRHPKSRSEAKEAAGLDAEGRQPLPLWPTGAIAFGAASRDSSSFEAAEVLVERLLDDLVVVSLPVDG